MTKNLNTQFDLYYLENSVNSRKPLVLRNTCSLHKLRDTLVEKQHSAFKITKLFNIPHYLTVPGGFPCHIPEETRLYYHFLERYLTGICTFHIYDVGLYPTVLKPAFCINAMPIPLCGD